MNNPKFLKTLFFFIVFVITMFIVLGTIRRSWAQEPMLRSTVEPTCEWVVRSGAVDLTELEHKFCFEGKGEWSEVLPLLITSLAIHEAELMKQMGFNPPNPVIPEGDGVYTLTDLDRELYMLLARALDEPTSPDVCHFLINYSGNLGLVVSERAVPEQTFRRVVGHLIEYFSDVEDAEAYCRLWLDPL